MPELPEVETLRRGLENEARGCRILDIIVANSKVLKGQSEVEFRERAVGRAVLAVERRGKYLLFPLGESACSSSSFTLCLHLKMRGSVRLRELGMPLERYGVVRLVLEKNRALDYEDMWCWGEWRALAQDELPSLPAQEDEPLAASWDREEFSRRLSNKRAAVKTVLLDQKIVAGVGNIYADESLFQARVAPLREAASLTTEESLRLAESIRRVLAEAVELGGTRGDYVDLYGRQGQYVPRVYDRHGEPCPQCQRPLTKIKLGGRGTTFCATCQN